MATLYERCKPPQKFVGSYYIARLLSGFLPIAPADYARHWQLEGPRAPEEVK